jgi:hypothetical protein
MTISAVDRNVTFTLYCNLMAEIKTRNNAAARVMANIHAPKPSVPLIEPEFAGEFSYFQLRKMCELVAVACLLAHGDVEKTRTGRLRGTYHARTIIKALEQLNPDFFPLPYEIQDAPPFEPKVVTTLTDGVLTKAELLSLYDNECGPAMHFGSAEDLLAGRRLQIQESRIGEWFTKFFKLLVRHRIRLSSDHEEVWVDMSFPEAEVRAMLMVPAVATANPLQVQRFSTPEGSMLTTSSPSPISA